MNIGKFSPGILFSHSEAPSENLLPNQRFGFETVPSCTVSTSDSHYSKKKRNKRVFVIKDFGARHSRLIFHKLANQAFSTYSEAERFLLCIFNKPSTEYYPFFWNHMVLTERFFCAKMVLQG